MTKQTAAITSAPGQMRKTMTRPSEETWIKSLEDASGKPSKEASAGQRRGGLAIMGSLIGLIRPLMGVMILAILLGVIGYVCAISLTILAGQVIVSGEKLATVLMVGAALFRGVFHYVEQYCNHYIAFKILAMIRQKVFDALRQLSPAKLEGRDKGNLISLITTDIELLEVFYAHTISPIAIAFITSLVMVVFMCQFHLVIGGVALLGYLLVGVVIPLWNGKRGRKTGMEFRNSFGELNSFVLDALRGMPETIQYKWNKEQKKQMKERSKKLREMQKRLSRMEGTQKALTNTVVLLFSFFMLFLTYSLHMRGQLGLDGVVLCTLAMMGSFGPVIALSNLSNNLHQTLASGERILSILEESPQVREVPRKDKETGEVAYRKREFTGGKVENVSFSYGEEEILRNCMMDIPSGQIVGIYGPSGCGKSTLLKLLMRFWDVDRGKISLWGTDIRKIPTADLRDCQSYVTQETHLFHDTIAANIKIGKLNATMEEVISAAKKASIHDFIANLNEGYETQVGELGETLSGGERQRIGLARAFLHDSPLMLLDEPTSNLDALNEGIILKSLKDFGGDKTIILVSHRKSTLNVSHRIYEMKNPCNR